MAGKLNDFSYGPCAPVSSDRVISCKIPLLGQSALKSLVFTKECLYPVYELIEIKHILY